MSANVFESVMAKLPQSQARQTSSETLRKLSAGEFARFAKAQRGLGTQFEFDPDTQLTDSERDLIMRALRAPGTSKEQGSVPTVAQEARAASSAATTKQESREPEIARLRRDKKALEWLAVQGCGENAIAQFCLALAKPARGPVAPRYVDALKAPVRDRHGLFLTRYVFHNIPGVTIDNRDEKPPAWTAGDPLVYYADVHRAQRGLFVCGSLLDLWATWEAIQGHPLADTLLLVCSTDRDADPDEWKSAKFWEGWEQVYVGHGTGALDNRTGNRAGDEKAKAVARRAEREMKRVWPVGFETWAEYFSSGKKAKDFEQLVTSAAPLSAKDLDDIRDPWKAWFEVAPIDIRGGYHNGYLYEVRQMGAFVNDPVSGELGEKKHTVVVRSDRTTHTVRQMPAAKGTPADQLIYRLWPDSTIVEPILQPRAISTWRLASIRAFIEGTSSFPALSAQLGKISGYLRASVWLPHDDDYTLLACTAVVTYCQSIFESVPLLLATGSKDSGKTQLGKAMSKLCANAPATPIGQISAASIARLIDMTRGFVALDDLEAVGARRGGDAQFDDLVQALKLSYNQTTAVKMWTNMKTGRIERLNFFGVKMIGNTRGVDSILGSRMFTIATQTKPADKSLAKAGLISAPEIERLRDELHTWAFSSVQAIQQAYTLVHPDKTTRSDEIAAPLRAISHLAGSPSIRASLERALEHQRRVDIQPETPEQVLREALIRIVTSSLRTTGMIRTVATITEIMNEMALLVDYGYRKRLTNEFSEIESPEWIGRQLKQLYSDTSVKPKRIEIYGSWLRMYRLREDFIAAALQEESIDGDLSSLRRDADPKSFCRGCSECPYRMANCDIRQRRLQAEGQKSAQHRPN